MNRVEMRNRVDVYTLFAEMSKLIAMLNASSIRDASEEEREIFLKFAAKLKDATTNCANYVEGLRTLPEDLRNLPCTREIA